MLLIDDIDHTIRLDPKYQQSLKQFNLTEFRVEQSLLLKLVMSEDFKVCLDCVEVVAMEQKVSQGIVEFEFEIMDRFVRGCLRTTFPEFRQKYMKAVKMFLIRMRTSVDKDIKKYVSTPDSKPSPSLDRILLFLRSTLLFL